MAQKAVGSNPIIRPKIIMYQAPATKELFVLYKTNSRLWYSGAMQLEYFGLLVFVILVAGLAFVLWRWPQGIDKTFSQHVAVAPYRATYYALLFAVVLPLLLIFLLGWFVPTFGLPSWFGVSVTLAAMLQQACTFVPETGGWRTKLHRAFAGMSALFLLPPLVALVFTPGVPRAGKLLSALGLICMASIIVVAASQRGKRYQLMLQIAYYMAFFVPILGISYLIS